MYIFIRIYPLRSKTGDSGRLNVGAVDPVGNMLVLLNKTRLVRLSLQASTFGI